MNRDEAMHKWKNALHAQSLVIEALDRTPQNAPPEDINRLRLLERDAWRQLGYVRKLVIEAILESIGF
jgi:hypothetical protein